MENGRIVRDDLRVLVCGLPDEFVRTVSSVEEFHVEHVGRDIEKLISGCSESSPDPEKLRTVTLVPVAFILEAGENLLRRLICNGSSTRVVVIGAPQKPVIQDLLSLGCAGLLHENSSQQDVRRAILAVADGELWFSRKILSAAIRSAQVSTFTEKGLTVREREILRLIGQGFNNREIAEALFISRETVRWHVRGLYAKLGTHDRKRATALALASSDRHLNPILVDETAGSPASAVRLSDEENHESVSAQ